jgi:TonB family protein
MLPDFSKSERFSRTLLCRFRIRLIRLVKIILLVLSFLLLVGAAIFGLVGSYRVDVLRTDLANANAARDAAEHRETEFKTREAAVAGAEAKIAEAENKATKAQTELLTLQSEKAELESKLDASRNEIAGLQKRTGEAAPPASPSQNPSTASKPKQQPTTSGPSVKIAREPVEEATPPPPPRRKQQVVPIKAQQVAGTLGTMSISSASDIAVFAPRPEYPRDALSHRIAGSGVCVVSVDRGSGLVTKASIAQSTGNQILDKSAVSTFQTWIFKPRKVSRVSISFGFTTSGAPY